MSNLTKDLTEALARGEKMKVVADRANDVFDVVDGEEVAPQLGRALKKLEDALVAAGFRTRDDEGSSVAGEMQRKGAR